MIGTTADSSGYERILKPGLGARVKIKVNGEDHDLPAKTTVAQLIAFLKLDPRFLAIERNRELVPRTHHAECCLDEGDELEIVTLVGGG